MIISIYLSIYLPMYVCMYVYIFKYTWHTTCYWMDAKLYVNIILSQSLKTVSSYTTLKTISQCYIHTYIHLQCLR